MMCASSGWSVEASARIAIFAPRRFRCRALARRRTVVMKDGIASRLFYYITGSDLNACARTVFGGSGWNDDQVETAALAVRQSEPPRRPRCTTQSLPKHITLLGCDLNWVAISAAIFACARIH